MLDFYPVTAAENVIIMAHTLPSLLEGGVSPFNGDKPLKAAFYVEKGMLSAIRILPPHGEEGTFFTQEKWRLITLPADQLLVPAFVDCHLHLALDGVFGFRTFTAPPPPHILLERLRALAFAGVMAVRDGGDKYGSAFQAQELCAGATPAEPLPRVVATGPAIYRKGHYGAKLGGEGLNDELQGLEKMIEKRKAAGAQQLKVVISGLVSLQEFGRVGPLQFSLAELKSVVQLARAYELPVMVHASSDAAVRLAVQAGVDSVEHGYYIREESLREMAEACVTWVPTVAPLAAMAGLNNSGADRSKTETSPGAATPNTSPASPAPPPEGSTALLNRIVAEHLSMIERGHQLGVIIGVGSDGGAPGVSWEEGYWLELKLLARAGFSPAELLTLAAVKGSRILGMAKDRGRIAVGKPPCWLCLEMSFLNGSIERECLKGIVFTHQQNIL